MTLGTRVRSLADSLRFFLSAILCEGHKEGKAGDDDEKKGLKGSNDVTNDGLCFRG